MSKNVGNKLWIVSFPLCFTALITGSAFHYARANQTNIIVKQAPAKTMTSSHSANVTSSRLPTLENPISCYQIEQAIDEDIKNNKQRIIHMKDINRLCPCDEIQHFNSLHKDVVSIPDDVACGVETTITEKTKHKKTYDYDDCDDYDDDNDCDD